MPFISRCQNCVTTAESTVSAAQVPSRRRDFTVISFDNTSTDFLVFSHIWRVDNSLVIAVGFGPLLHPVDEIRYHQCQWLCTVCVPARCVCTEHHHPCLRRHTVRPRSTRFQHADLTTRKICPLHRENEEPRNLDYCTISTVGSCNG